jgi:hypothetical protein
MYLSLHNDGVCITLPVACNDHEVTLIWDEWTNGKGYRLGGAWCEQCRATYLPVLDETSRPYGLAALTERYVPCDDMGGY